jgi:hypothetical protein
MQTKLPMTLLFTLKAKAIRMAIMASMAPSSLLGLPSADNFPSVDTQNFYTQYAHLFPGLVQSVAGAGTPPTDPGAQLTPPSTSDFPNIAQEEPNVAAPGPAATDSTELPISTQSAVAYTSPTPAPAPPVSGGIKTTHYGYAGDPFGDKYSARGIGAFGDNKLVPLQSVALTSTMAKKLKVSPGDQIQATDTNGQMHILTYDDKAPEEDARIDIYNPNGSDATGEPFRIAKAVKYTPTEVAGPDNTGDTTI